MLSATVQIQKLTQFHYTGWPDFDAPTNTQSIISLVKEVRKRTAQLRKQECKILVHCSAGVGRTGTFIALYRIMKQLENSATIAQQMAEFSDRNWEDHYALQSVDIFNTVLKLRRERVHMVSKFSI